jgi:hypothetical protein
VAISGIGAYYGEDVSNVFIAQNIAGPGWDISRAPPLHQSIRSLNVGDIVYLKSFAPTSSDIIAKGMGVVANEALVTGNPLVAAGRNLRWPVTDQLRIPKPEENKCSAQHDV